MSRYLLGAAQPGICMRCGKKDFASALVFDGRNPQLLVCGQCWDPAHPQERPFVVNDTEGLARFPVSPEQPFDMLPVATVEIINPPGSTEFTVTPEAREGFVGYSDGSIWTMFGSRTGDLDGYTIAEFYTDATHQKLTLGLVDAPPDPFAALVVAGLRFGIENATVRQISDVRTFEWTITESLLTAGVLVTITVQYA